jgi:hypothetical protein
MDQIPPCTTPPHYFDPEIPVFDES